MLMLLADAGILSGDGDGEILAQVVEDEDEEQAKSLFMMLWFLSS